MKYNFSDLPKRFREKVNKTDSCWLWTASKRSIGYGEYWLDGKKVGAHRFSFAYFNGCINPEINVLHKCDVPACVNPDHLFLGTQKENMVDMMSKGRAIEGEKRVNAKLTKIQVEEIRRIYVRGVPGYKNDFSQPWIAKKYGISVALVSNIINNKKRIGG